MGTNFADLFLVICIGCMFGGLALMFAPTYKRLLPVRRTAGLAIALVCCPFLSPVKPIYTNIHLTEETIQIQSLSNSLDELSTQTCLQQEQTSLAAELKMILNMNDQKRALQQFRVYRAINATRSFIQYVHNTDS